MKYFLLPILMFLLAVNTRAQDSTNIKSPNKENRPSNTAKGWKPVNVMPEFPGGEKKLFKYIKKKIKYPETAKASKIEGTVIVQFVINEDGSISDVIALSQVGGGCTEEALWVIGSMPKWKPGTQDGKAVKVYYHIPVSFHL